MKLVFLHGAPAVGKLTVGRALAREVSGRLLDNHTAIDLARAVFDFDAPGFWELVETVWLSALDAAGRHGVALVVTTYCYSEPDDREVLDRFDAVLARHGGALLPVFLTCSEAEARRRVGNADRIARRKIASVQALEGFRARWNIVPVPRGNCLSLDTSGQSPEATAAEIVRHFGLARTS